MRDKHTPYKILLSIVVAVALLGGATAVVWDNRAEHDANKAKVATAQQTPAASQDVKAASTKEVSYKGEEGKTALELLRQHATVVTKDSSYGPYVDSIGGVKGGTDGKYWMFYVNGQQATVGANDYVTKAGDTIQWKFE